MNQKLRHWKDREDNRRPTPERKAKSPVWRFADAEDAGSSYAMDEHASPIQAAYSRQLIDSRQWDASCNFLELAIRHKGPTGRSCLNFEPVGHDEIDDEAASKEYRELVRYVDFIVWREVYNVVYREEPVTDIARLRAGLDDMANFFGC